MDEQVLRLVGEHLGHHQRADLAERVPLELTGSTATRDGRLRAAISDLIALAHERGCAAIAIEDLGFAEARATGRESMGRGRRGEAFRRTVAGIPTARFRERLRGMTYHVGLVVVSVDPAAHPGQRGMVEYVADDQAEGVGLTGTKGAGDGVRAVAQPLDGYGGVESITRSLIKSSTSC
ncbi:hypothetical protein [Streptomyces sp. NPDC001450]